jgi:hypothetical protein
MNTQQKIIKKWYDFFEFDKRLDEPFLQLLWECAIPEGLTVDTAKLSADAGEEQTLTLLYLCDFMEREYERRGLPREMFLTNVRWVKEKIESTYLKNGSFSLGDSEWNRPVFSAKLFRLGRLQFGLGKSPVDIPSKDVKKGDEVLQLHIPSGEKLGFDACVESINRAVSVVEKHFPEFKYRYMTCLSWLLDNSVADLLGEGSNVLKFATLFEIVANNESDSIIRFVYGGGATRADLPNITPKGRFQTALKDEAMRGRVFFCPRGVIDLEGWRASERYVKY